MPKLAHGVLSLTGVDRVSITGMEFLTATSQIFFRPLTSLVGTLVRSELIPGVGFGVSSTSANDTGEVAWEVWD
jgi:hypothetical protein